MPTSPKMGKPNRRETFPYALAIRIAILTFCSYLGVCAVRTALHSLQIDQ